MGKIDVTDDEIKDRIADLDLRLETARGRVQSMNKERERLLEKLAKRGRSMRVRIVTDHALLRYLERHKGIDLDAIRDEIRGLADEALAFKDGEHYRHPNGVVMVLGNKGKVVTILSPEQSEKFNGRKLATPS